jgi:vacuolar-type H+-ATPase subunit E/Vma4
VALADLIAALEADVERKAVDEHEAGRREAEHIGVTSAQRLTQQRAELLAMHEASRRRVLAGEVAEAETAIRARLLDARERVLGRIFDRVREQLPGLQSGEPYRSGLANELADALTYVQGADDVMVRCAPSLVSALRPLLAAGTALRLEADASILAGFRVLAGGGRVEVDRTLETRLRRLAPQLRIDIVRRLEAAATETGRPGSGEHALG